MGRRCQDCAALLLAAWSCTFRSVHFHARLTCAPLRSPSHPAPRSDLLLTQLWPALPGEERTSVLTRLAVAQGREKLPAVQALAAQLATKLQQLGP